jgi:hypothetical protein
MLNAMAKCPISAAILVGRSSFLSPVAATPKGKAAVAEDARYTCPMHPEVRQAQPGDCPKCGMPLELATVKAGSEEGT